MGSSSFSSDTRRPRELHIAKPFKGIEVDREGSRTSIFMTIGGDRECRPALKSNKRLGYL